MSAVIITATQNGSLQCNQRLKIFLDFWEKDNKHNMWTSFFILIETGLFLCLEFISYSCKHFSSHPSYQKRKRGRITIYIYIYIYWPIGPNELSVYQWPERLESIPGRVIPKTQKMVLDTSLIDTQHYKVYLE